MGSDHGGEFGERGRDSIPERDVDSKFVVTSAEVLHEGVSGRKNDSGPDSFESPHRAQPRLEPTVISLDPVVSTITWTA